MAKRAQSSDQQRQSGDFDQGALDKSPRPGRNDNGVLATNIRQNGGFDWEPPSPVNADLGDTLSRTFTQQMVKDPPDTFLQKPPLDPIGEVIEGWPQRQPNRGDFIGEITGGFSTVDKTKPSRSWGKG